MIPQNSYFEAMPIFQNTKVIEIGSKGEEGLEELKNNPTYLRQFTYEFSDKHKHPYPFKGYIPKNKWDEDKFKSDTLETQTKEINDDENYICLLKATTKYYPAENIGHSFTFIPHDFKRLDVIELYIKVKNFNFEILDYLQFNYIALGFPSNKFMDMPIHINLLLGKLVGYNIEEIDDVYKVPIFVSMANNNFMINKYVSAIKICFDISNVDTKVFDVVEMKCIGKKVDDERKIDVTNGITLCKRNMYITYHEYFCNGELLRIRDYCVYFLINCISTDYFKDLVETPEIMEVELIMEEHKIIFKQEDMLKLEFADKIYYGLPLSAQLKEKKDFIKFLKGNKLNEYHGLDLGNQVSKMIIKTNLDNTKLYFSVYGLCFRNHQIYGV